MQVISKNDNQIALDEIKVVAAKSKKFILVYLSNGKLYYCSEYTNHCGERGYCWRGLELCDCHTATIGDFEYFLERNAKVDCMHFFYNQAEFIHWLKTAKLA